MKTKKNPNRNIPSPFRVSMYLIAVAVFCFLNWAALRANDPESYDQVEKRLEAALAEVPDPEPELEDWMLNFSEDFDLVAEKELELEEWMTNYDVFCQGDEPEQEIEEWMVNIESWESSELLSEK